MSEHSKIEWTDSSWNPMVGCSDVSSGCTNCYAKRTIHRLAGNPNAKIAAANAGLTRVLADGRIGWTGEVNCLPDRLDAPLHWKAPRRIFVNSQSDLFHEKVPERFIDQVFAVMALCPQHTFQVLTKRPDRMASLLNWVDVTRRRPPRDFVDRIGFEMNLIEGKRGDHPRLVPGWGPKPLGYLPNVWLGTSIEDQPTADERVTWLLRIPAAVRFLSAEPLLGLVSVERYLHRMVIRPNEELTDRMVEIGWSHSGGDGDHPAIDWVICGGESGPGARPMDPAWARSLRDQCSEAGVPFFFKQWGSWSHAEDVGRSDGQGHWCEHARSFRGPGEGVAYKRVQKKRAGRLLDGKLHDEYPCGAAQ